VCVCVCRERKKMTVNADMGFNKQDAVTLGAKVELSKIRPTLNMQMRYYLADRGHFDKPRAHTHFDKSGHTHKDPY